jgi:hypothetical protein
MGKHVAVSVFFAIIAAMTTGGMWRAFHLDGTDAVLAITFAVVLSVTLAVQRLR